MENDIDLLLKWRQTWPEKDADYIAESTTYHGSIGRIYRIEENHGPMGGKWFWAFNAFGPEISRNIGQLTGHTDSPREAAREVERSWFAAIEGSSLDVPAVPVKAGNSYAVAKGRE